MTDADVNRVHAYAVGTVDACGCKLARFSILVDILRIAKKADDQCPIQTVQRARKMRYLFSRVRFPGRLSHRYLKNEDF